MRSIFWVERIQCIPILPQRSSMSIIHPKGPMPYVEAIPYVEKFLAETVKLPDGWVCNIYDYFDGDADVGPHSLNDRPYVGVRVAEVSFHTTNGGSSYMQTDIPWGIAFCGQVERC